MWAVSGRTRDGVARDVPFAQLEGGIVDVDAVRRAVETVRGDRNVDWPIHLLDEEAAIAAELRLGGLPGFHSIETWAPALESELRDDPMYFDVDEQRVALGVRRGGLALFRRDAEGASSPLTSAAHEQSVVVVALDGSLDSLTLSYQSTAVSRSRAIGFGLLDQLPARQRDEFYLDWRAYIGQQSGIVAGIARFGRRVGSVGRRVVELTVLPPAGFLVGLVVRVGGLLGKSTQTDPTWAHRLRRASASARLPFTHSPEIAPAAQPNGNPDSVKAHQRLVVLVHGTFSTCPEAFAQLPPSQLPKAAIVRFEHDTFAPIATNAKILAGGTGTHGQGRAGAVACAFKGWTRSAVRGGDPEWIPTWKGKPTGTCMWSPSEPLHDGTPAVASAAGLLKLVAMSGSAFTGPIPHTAMTSAALGYLLLPVGTLPTGIREMEPGESLLDLLPRLKSDAASYSWGSSYKPSAIGFGWGMSWTTKEDSDLVVPTASALHFGSQQPTLTCGHSQYFEQTAVRQFLANFPL